MDRFWILGIVLSDTLYEIWKYRNMNEVLSYLPFSMNGYGNGVSMTFQVEFKGFPFDAKCFDNFFLLEIESSISGTHDIEDSLFGNSIECDVRIVFHVRLCRGKVVKYDFAKVDKGSLQSQKVVSGFKMVASRVYFG